MRFSVIIPALNEEKNIEKCLRSIRNQDYPKKDYEIVVVDGNSSDKTREIAGKYARVITEKRKGIALARNTGARHARGEILVFVDSDTIIDGRLFSRLEKEFSDKRVVGAAVNVVPDDRAVKFVLVHTIFNMITRASTHFGLSLVGGVCFPCRKDAFLKIDGFNEKMHSAEDINFSLRLNRVGKFRFLGDVHAVTSMRRMRKWGLLYFAYRYLNGSGFLLSSKKEYLRVD